MYVPYGSWYVHYYFHIIQWVSRLIVHTFLRRLSPLLVSMHFYRYVPCIQCTSLFVYSRFCLKSVPMSHYLARCGGLSLSIILDSVETPHCFYTGECAVWPTVIVSVWLWRLGSESTKLSSTSRDSMKEILQEAGTLRDCVLQCALRFLAVFPKRGTQ